MDITADNKKWTPSNELFNVVPLLKMMLQFDEPFWLNPENNRGGFEITDAQGNNKWGFNRDIDLDLGGASTLY